MFEPDVVGSLHVGLAAIAIILGILVFALRKGTLSHRVCGSAYAASLALLDFAALALHREATFGPFHVLALVSLTTILVAVGIMAFTSRSAAVIATHAFLMAWSYAGLIAAGVGQLTVQLKFNSAGTVWVAILITLAIAGVVIHVQVPRTLRNVLG